MGLRMGVVDSRSHTLMRILGSNSLSKGALASDASVPDDPVPDDPVPDDTIALAVDTIAAAIASIKSQSLLSRTHVPNERTTSRPRLS